MEMSRRRRLVQKSSKISKGRPHVQLPPSPIFIARHKTLRLVAKAFNIHWFSLVKTKVSTCVWPTSFQDIKDFWKKVILV
jgi:hypothetical protein